MAPCRMLFLLAEDGAILEQGTEVHLVLHLLQLDSKHLDHNQYDNDDVCDGDDKTNDHLCITRPITKQMMAILLMLF